jgi:hypothetical protein
MSNKVYFKKAKFYEGEITNETEVGSINSTRFITTDDILQYPEEKLKICRVKRVKKDKTYLVDNFLNKLGVITSNNIKI